MSNYLEEYSKIIEPRDKRQLTRRFIKSFKHGKQCLDCSQTFPYYILQFDHVRGPKVGDINTIARLGDMQLLLAELEKVELICSNCHFHREKMRSVGLLPKIN